MPPHLGHVLYVVCPSIYFFVNYLGLTIKLLVIIISFILVVLNEAGRHDVKDKLLLLDDGVDSVIVTEPAGVLSGFVLIAHPAPLHPRSVSPLPAVQPHDIRDNASSCSDNTQQPFAVVVMLLVIEVFVVEVTLPEPPSVGSVVCTPFNDIETPEINHVKEPLNVATQLLVPVVGLIR